MKCVTLLGLCCACVLLVVGVPIFFTYTFAHIPNDKRRRDEFELVSCGVVGHNVHEYDCSRKTACSCLDACLARGTCVAAQEVVGTDGPCCDGSCCRQTCCDGCYREECTTTTDEDGDKTKTCQNVWDACCTRSCCAYGTTECTVTWSKCWDVTVLYEAFVPSENHTYTASQTSHCGYGDFACPNGTKGAQPVGSARDCWFDTTHATNVDNSYIRYDPYELNDSFRAAVICGIVFMSLAGCILLVVCTASLRRHCRRRRSFDSPAPAASPPSLPTYAVQPEPSAPPQQVPCTPHTQPEPSAPPLPLLNSEL
eukprot:TRINITY_DN5495_c1_g2_i1.p1 TRINITY_DN5495_c1_g2~~TRINITY_DN5495_c1_g2_i1.p1  ORF type:complete len:311 (+),score=38.97 TRINITY_DN5495_c1_g2_i1:43-975(+)